MGGSWDCIETPPLFSDISGISRDTLLQISLYSRQHAPYSCETGFVYSADQIGASVSFPSINNLEGGLAFEARVGFQSSLGDALSAF